MSESSEVEVHSSVVEDWGELTKEEERELHRLELRVERAVCEAGTALREIRDKRLYRSTHSSFEQYCYERFGYTRRRPYQLIEAAIVFENLCTNGTQISEPENVCTNGTQNDLFPFERQILPTSERQVRDLINLEPDEQRQIWQQAVVEAGGKVPSGRIVKGIVERLKDKQLRSASDFCSVGDAFTLIQLEGEQRKYNGCWAITSHINDFTILVDVHDGTILVKPENLKPFDEPDVRRQLPQTLKRIRRLRNVGMLDRCTYTVLDFFGRQTYLSDLEDDLLTFFEQRHGIKD